MPETPDLADYEWPTCPCGRQLRNDELGRVACRLCQDRADTVLRQLPGPKGLYAGLARVLVPGVGSGVRVTGSRTAPLPLRIEPLSLQARGGVVTVLQTWLVDWHELLEWRHPRWRGGLQQQLDDVVHALRVNLEWAATEHPAFGEFTDEVSSLVRQCERQISGERSERPVAVLCAEPCCGRVLYVTVSTPGVRCGCGVQYAREAALSLTLANRSTTAA
ncbi:hypothetical protein ACFXI6_14240 [Streptomyces mirabilis]|uniref:hypothetical protein n=1 Tax=Streptomyces mirabilis TaxID=68239 RepID=UPI00367B43CE